MSWLCRKASTFLERRGGAATETVFALASARALDPEDYSSLAEAFEDPIVIDLALTEGGWFERFLDERGALLPEDELLLARSWTLVERSVFDVLDVQPGQGMTLRDLRSGEEVDVRERTLSTQVSPGMMCCARVVADGQFHQFVGGIFGVRVGEEARVLDLCDAGDAFAIARWVADSNRPPILTNRVHEEMVQCNVVLAAMEQMRDRYEERWCDEVVPALGGVTPREAAADPTRRESVERLISSFEEMPDPAGGLGPMMRPARLRELLDLTP